MFFALTIVNGMVWNIYKNYSKYKMWRDMEDQDKIYEIEINSCGIEGNLRIQNSNNRVLAKIGDALLDKLNYYRWNNAVKFFDKYEQKKTKRNSIGKEIPLPQNIYLKY